jgi:predicted amidohydrolase YtcJ
MIHSQTIREDQLDKFAGLGLTPSFFPVHIYYWGDKHYNIFLGPTRANRINPIGSALKRNLTYTLHNDSPVVIAGIFNGVNTFLKIISSAVNRVTSSGKVLDDGTQKISAYDALKGVTINSAWQSHEENIKGSIETGKVADLVILNLNPLKIKPT